MSFVAEAERTIEATPQRVFDRLADVASWPTWMPRTFVLVVRGRGAAAGAVRSAAGGAVGGAAGIPSPFRLGDRFRVKVGGSPIASTLRVSILVRPRELAWRGGIRGVLWAEHRFVLEADGDHRTRVRSIETWRGALAGVLRRLIEPAAIRIGGEQLEGLARAAARARDVN